MKQKISLFILIFIVGCATHKPAVLGFLSSYELMKESPIAEGLFFYKDPSINIQKYKKVIVEPVLIFEEKPKLNKYEIDRLSTYFQDELKIAFSRGYVVSDSFFSKDVLYIRSVIKVWPSEPILNIHWSTTLPGIGIGGASMEMELVDGQTDKTILEFMKSEKGDRFKKIDGLSKWTHTKKVLKDWASEIKSIFDGFQGK
ncbi:MAG: DUF3313 family protein [Candidatus Aceula lacicola]|nr:DUF3313 family protein [Candidatus Aceula lacicola]